MTLDHYVTLGRSGLRVSPFTLGTMTFGQEGGSGSSPAVSVDILARYLDLGGNSVDTANIYANGHAEKIIGDYLADRTALRDRVVLGTKFFGNLHVGDPNGGGCGRKAVLSQLEASLRRLRTDYVDVYWIHNWDTATPIEETLRTLDDLVSAGKIRYVGISDFPAWKAAEAQLVAGFRGWVPAVALQLEYSLIERTVEAELIPMANAFDLAVMGWSPLRRGMLSGRWRPDHRVAGGSSSGAPVPGGEGEPTAREWTIIETLHDVAGSVGATPAATALAWVHSRSGVSSTIIGARTMTQLAADLEALDVTLSAQQVSALDSASAPSLGFPHENNRRYAATSQYAGATVDGHEHAVSPGLLASPARY